MEKWFNNKVLKKAKNQIKNSIEYFQKIKNLEIQNDKGHKRNLEKIRKCKIIKVILYDPGVGFSNTLRFQKFYNSKTNGLIHLFHLNDYYHVCKYLITFPEIVSYLEHRENIYTSSRLNLDIFPEQLNLGHFFSGELASTCDTHHITYLNNYAGHNGDYDLKSFFDKFPESIVYSKSTTDYYFILEEIAKLTRNELVEFKKRFSLTLEKTQSNNYDIPYRISSPNTNCSFVFIPLDKSHRKNWFNALHNFTVAHKYDQKTQKCVGLTMYQSATHDKHIEIQWHYIDSNWEYNKELEENLQNNFPFREVKSDYFGGYKQKTSP